MCIHIIKRETCRSAHARTDACTHTLLHCTCPASLSLCVLLCRVRSRFCCTCAPNIAPTRTRLRVHYHNCNVWLNCVCMCVCVSASVPDTGSIIILKRAYLDTRAFFMSVQLRRYMQARKVYILYSIWVDHSQGEQRAKCWRSFWWLYACPQKCMYYLYTHKRGPGSVVACKYCITWVHFNENIPRINTVHHNYALFLAMVMDGPHYPQVLRPKTICLRTLQFRSVYHRMYIFSVIFYDRSRLHWQKQVSMNANRSTIYRPCQYWKYLNSHSISESKLWHVLP